MEKDLSKFTFKTIQEAVKDFPPARIDGGNLPVIFVGGKDRFILCGVARTPQAAALNGLCYGFSCEKISTALCADRKIFMLHA